MRFISTLLFWFFTCMAAESQTIQLVQVTQLPGVANESSGLVKTGPDIFWTHNDNGGLPQLYAFDSSGTLLRTLQLFNCTNVDWEDLAHDAAGNIYIGDFGNNFNFRNELKIYRIPAPDTITSPSYSIQDTIRFYYEDQLLFPPPLSQWNYDLEAMTIYQDSIYLFTKNRTQPYTGFSRVYVLPASPGFHAAEFRDSIFTGIGTIDNYSITGAAITSDGTRLILMSNLRMWRITNFNIPFFSQGIKSEFIFNSVTQKEAITLEGDSVAWLSDEGIQGNSGYLYRLAEDSILTTVEQIPGRSDDIFPNPFTSLFTIRLDTPVREMVITDLNGNVLLRLDNSAKEQKISANHLLPGIYLLRTTTHAGVNYRKLIRQ